MAALPVVSVVTASSTSGAQAVQDLLTKYSGKVHVRGCYRTTEKAAPVIAQFAGNEAFSTVVGIDAAKPESLVPAFAGADYAVIVTPHDAAGDMKNDAKYTLNMIEAAEKAGVKHVVFVGSWTVNAAEAIPAIATRFVEPEAALTGAAQMHWTLLRSGFFFSNFAGMLGNGLKAGTVRFPDLTIPAVDPRDMGRVAAAIFASADPAVHHGQKYDISGPESLKIHQVVAAIGEATGKAVAYQAVPAVALKAFVPPFIFDLLTYCEEKGDAAIPQSDITQTIAGEHTSFAAWLKGHAHLFA